MASISQTFGNVTARDGNLIVQGVQLPLSASALERRPFRHGNPPPLNRNFLGRESEIAEIKAAFRDAAAGIQKRCVIYGLAGIGKSEICVKLLNDMQNEYWGIFWVDVSDFASAEADFKKIADQIHPGRPHQTLGEALSVLAEVDVNTHPWLLILDNADESGDYARFFPSASGGSILMTSRDSACAVHETIGSHELMLISVEESVELLFKAAQLRKQDWDSYRPQAMAITGLLGSHTLALIQAGALLSQDIRNWDQYPKIFDDNRQHLLTTSPRQAQSKYGNVYATFEVSARALKFDGGTEAEDALCLLGILAMFHHSGFPTSVFEDASRGFGYAKEFGYSNQVNSISEGLARLLPAFLLDSRALTLRLQPGLCRLEGLSFIKQASIDNEDGVKLVSMHPLAHAWAKDRLDQRLQEQAWVLTGSIIAHSAKADLQKHAYWDTSNWEFRVRQLQSHISAFLDNSAACRPRDPWVVEHRQVDFVVVTLLVRCQIYQNLEPFLLEIFKMLEAEPSRPENVYLLPFHKSMARVWYGLNKYPSSLDLWRQIIKLEEANSLFESERIQSKHDLASAYLDNGAIKEAITQLESVVQLSERICSANDSLLLDSQHELGRAYRTNGQVKEAVKLFEHVVRSRKGILGESNPDLLVSQHELGRAYLEDGQVKEGVKLLEHVVQIRQGILAESSPDLLDSQHVLGCAYEAAKRYQEALRLIEHVAEIERKMLSPNDPSHLATLSWLPELYIRSHQPEKAKEVVVEADSALRNLPKDDTRWQDHGGWLARWKRRLGMECGS
ncbi:hypothetical protein SLS55_010202 [Diplodia seriata]|uniref:NB-ARC domain-containing protein n=1 Tax=Diplodia seriata TaxID=420778 RepID=A0ABR3BZD9_9PEZI